MVVEKEAIRELIHEMAEIPDENRPKLFKGRSIADFDAWVRRARRALADQFGVDAQFSTTHRNLEGSDLVLVGTNIEIELKTGQVTDANIGIGSMAWAIGDEDEAVLYDIMVESMHERRSMGYRGDYAGIRANQNRTMDRLHAYLDERLEVGQLAPPKLAHYSRAVARGITKASEIKPLLGTIESEWEVPWLLHAKWRAGWIARTNPFDPQEDILVEGVWRGHGGRSGIPRAQARVKGQSSGRTALFYPHYKNSFHGIAAKHWVQTACFHVWIDK